MHLHSLLKGGRMKSEAVVKTKAEAKPELPIFVKAEHLFEQMEKMYRTIADRAFELFSHREPNLGNDWEDWFRAESELLRRTPVEMTEADGALKVTIEVPGFKPEDLKVSVEPLSLMVDGKVETTEEKKEEEKTVYTEYRSNRIFRTLPLPKEVDPAQAKATLKDGILTLTLPVVVTEKGTKVEVKTE